MINHDLSISAEGIYNAGTATAKEACNINGVSYTKSYLLLYLYNSKDIGDSLTDYINNLYTSNLSLKTNSSCF